MTATTDTKQTPLMKQYNAIKNKYPDAILLFRVGDFYETFGNDAIIASKILSITLTKRANGQASHIELAGFPHHSVENYLPKLVKAGYRVAICDQLEDPKLTKTIVKRGVTELVTPGLCYNDNLLNNNSNNFLASVVINDQQAGVSFLDISTGEFLVAEGTVEYIKQLILNFGVKELLYDKSTRLFIENTFSKDLNLFAIDNWVYAQDVGYNSLLTHFGATSLKGFGIEHLKLAIASCGAILQYLQDTKHDQLQHLNAISRVESSQYMWLDQFTVRNLEIFASNHQQGTSLIDIINQTHTPMGARLLKRWVAFPLIKKELIDERLESVGFFNDNVEVSQAVSKLLFEIGDLERLASKVASNRINPREIIYLKNALIKINQINAILKDCDSSYLKHIINDITYCSELINKIENEINEDAPLALNKGQVIKQGVHAELDELRQIAFAGKDFLLKIQQTESEKTGISSLKVSYNAVFGYFLEVTNVHKDKVPNTWIRKQTLTNAERYITPELKEYEEKILGAEEKIISIEFKLYEQLMQYIVTYINALQKNANIIAQVDCLLGFSILSKQNKYSKPNITNDFTIHIENGRHPIIEKKLPIDTEYVSNSVYLDNSTQQILMITGPNMSGKSALLRQVALITLLSHIGSYVPASKATIALTDKIFTRVGATDNISSGESTFMMEMNETASILNNLSDRSLVLLDEIGRGTSTYDGISIAWAITEFIHNHQTYKTKTLFATHYHELNDMANLFNRIKNKHVAVKEVDNKIIFLRKLIDGGSEHSFGINVARMAGMPKNVVQRAREILQKLENIKPIKKLPNEDLSQTNNIQLTLYEETDPTSKKIKDILSQTEINTLTPVEALLKLNEIKQLIVNQNQ